MTKAKIKTEQEKLDKANEKNKGMRQILNHLMTVEFDEFGDDSRPTQLRRLLEYNKVIDQRRRTLRHKRTTVVEAK